MRIIYLALWLGFFLPLCFYPERLIAAQIYQIQLTFPDGKKFNIPAVIRGAPEQSGIPTTYAVYDPMHSEPDFNAAITNQPSSASRSFPANNVYGTVYRSAFTARQTPPESTTAITIQSIPENDTSPIYGIYSSMYGSLFSAERAEPGPAAQITIQPAPENDIPSTYAVYGSVFTSRQTRQGCDTAATNQMPPDKDVIQCRLTLISDSQNPPPLTINHNQIASFANILLDLHQINPAFPALLINATPASFSGCANYDAYRGLRRGGPCLLAATIICSAAFGLPIAVGAAKPAILAGTPLGAAIPALLLCGFSYQEPRLWHLTLTLDSNGFRLQPQGIQHLQTALAQLARTSAFNLISLTTTLSTTQLSFQVSIPASVTHGVDAIAHLGLLNSGLDITIAEAITVSPPMLLDHQETEPQLPSPLNQDILSQSSFDDQPTEDIPLLPVSEPEASDPQYPQGDIDEEL